MPPLADSGAAILAPTARAADRSWRIPGHLALEMPSALERQRVQIVSDAIPYLPLGWGEWTWAWLVAS